MKKLLGSGAQCVSLFIRLLQGDPRLRGRPTPDWASKKGDMRSRQAASPGFMEWKVRGLVVGERDCMGECKLVRLWGVQKRKGTAQSWLSLPEAILGPLGLHREWLRRSQDPNAAKTELFFGFGLPCPNPAWDGLTHGRRARVKVD